MHDKLLSGRVGLIGKVLVFSLILTGFIGCRSSKDIVKKPSQTEIKRLDQLVRENGNFQQLNSKVEFKFMPKEGVSAGMKGTLKLYRDSCILLSIQPFAGIEAVKCLIRKDSIIIVSRLHKTYSVESLRNFKYSNYLNMELIQALLSNRIFIPGLPNPTEKDLSKFEWHKQKNGNFFRWPDESLILDFRISEDGEYNEFKASSPERKEKIRVSYDRFETFAKGLFPYQIIFSLESPEKTVKLQITYLKADFDAPTDFKFDIPSKYKKITTEELIKRFQSML